MALIICGDCQKEYSNYALACPQCARPTISQKIIEDNSSQKIYNSTNHIKDLSKRFLKQNNFELTESEKEATAKKKLDAKKAAEAKKKLDAKKAAEAKKKLDAKKAAEAKKKIEVNEESENKLASIAFKKACNDDLVRSYLRDISRVPLLSHEQELTLGRQVQEYMQVERAELEIIELTGDKPSIEELSNKLDLSTSIIKKRMRAGQRAKERMVAANLRLVVSVAKIYTKRNMELLDLIQEGTIGLVRGVEKFNPNRGYKFSTYAYWWIRQCISRAIAEKSRAIRFPIHITEMLEKLKQGKRNFSQEMSRIPTVSELAKYVELPEDDVRDLICKAGQPISLETKVGDCEDTVLLDLLVGNEDLPDGQIEMDSMRGDLHSLLHQLPDMQCRVLRMRYGMDGDEPMSRTGIGKVLGINENRVRELERDGLRGLRRLSDNVEAYLFS